VVTWSTQAPAWQTAVMHAPAAGQLTSGSVPLVTAAQVPVGTPVSALVHAMHVPVQAALQHTPCTQ
jgi:hypothetical protein